MRSIRTRLALLSTLLALLAAGLAADRALDAWRRAGDAARAERASESTAALLAAAEAWAVERGTANGLLAAPAAATPAQREALAGARRRADEAFARGVAGARGLGGAAVEGAAGRAEGHLGRVAGLRAEVDRALAAGTPADPALRGAWFPAMSELTTAVGSDLVLAVEEALGPAEPFVSRALALQRALWEAGEFGGRERGVVNGVVAAGRPMTAAELGALGEARGRITSG